MSPRSGNPCMKELRRMQKNILMLIAAAFLLAVSAAPLAAGETQRAGRDEKKSFAASGPEELKAVKKAMPPAPPGWVVAGETTDAPRPGTASAGAGNLRFTYMIAYRRVSGVLQEKKMLSDAYAESSRKHRDEVRPLIDALIKQQTRTSLALKKASRRRNRVEEERLNNELDDHGRKMQALHDEVDGRIGLDVEPYLVRDAEASIRVDVNDDRAVVVPRGEPVSVPGAAFAFRREGERAGATTWKEGQTLVLYGQWEEKDRVIRARPLPSSGDSKARTIKITVTGDRGRVEQLLGQTVLKTLLKLLE